MSLNDRRLFSRSINAKVPPKTNADHRGTQIFLGEILVQSSYIYRHYPKWPIIQRLTQIFGITGFVVACVILSSSMRFLIIKIYFEKSILDEINNRVFFSCLTAIGDMSVYYDQINYNPVEFCSKFDENWRKIYFSWENQVSIDIAAKRKINRRWLIFFSLFQTWLIVVISFYAPNANILWLMILQFIRRGFLMINVLHIITVIDHLGTCSAFINSAFESITRQMDRISHSGSKSNQNDADRTDQMSFYRNVYEKIGQLIELVDHQHSIFVGVFYFLAVPKMVILIYDLVFTSSAFLIYHITESMFNVIRLIVITRCISQIPSYAESPKKNALNISMSTKDPSLMIEAELILERIGHQDFGIKIFGEKTVTSAITPTLITMVITYFIFISSFNSGSIVNTPTNKTV